jgi:hypothetical protein
LVRQLSLEKVVQFLNDFAEIGFFLFLERTEGADCYLAGAILPVVGTLLERRVAMPLGGGLKYPNLFTLICGKPGDRKSTTIRLGAIVARLCLPESAFIPSSFSPESLFDEYDAESNGRPDKL